MSFIGSVFHTDLNRLTVPTRKACVQQTAQFQRLVFKLVKTPSFLKNANYNWKLCC